MSARDKTILAVVAAIVLIGGMWTLVVSPERKQVSTVAAQISSERVSLATAYNGLAVARKGAAGYADHINQVHKVLLAIPSNSAEPGLIQTIDNLAGSKVDFKRLSVGNDAASSGVTTLGLTFTFDSTYGDLRAFLRSLDNLTTTNGTDVNGTGRLFTVTQVSLVPLPLDSPHVEATVTALVYQQSVATAAGNDSVTTLPTGATGATGTS